MNYGDFAVSIRDDRPQYTARIGGTKLRRVSNPPRRDNRSSAEHASSLFLSFSLSSLRLGSTQQALETLLTDRDPVARHRRGSRRITDLQQALPQPGAQLGAAGFHCQP